MAARTMTSSGTTVSLDEIIDQIDDLACSGDAKKALECCERALGSFPDDEILHALSIRLLSDLGRKYDARIALEKLLRTYPDAIEIQLAAGRLYAELGKYQKSEGYYRRVVKSSPEDWDAYRGLGSVLLAQHKLSSCRRLAARLRQSIYVLETERIAVWLTASVLLKEQKEKEAKNYILQNLGSCWGDFEILSMLREFHPRCTRKTRLWQIRVKGGEATLGIFLQFTDEHIGTYDVLADSDFEAVSFIEEISGYARPQDKVILSAKIIGSSPPPNMHKGVVITHPFTL